MRLIWWATRPISCLGVPALWTLSAFAFGQSQELATFYDANVTYHQCVLDGVKPYAATQERPDDIVDAAMGGCVPEREAIYQAILAAQQQALQKTNPPAARSKLIDIDKLARQKATKAILEARYPKTK